MSQVEPIRPLAGIKVLDLSRILAGPFCCQLLADLGADVVKVERPGAGDDTRQWGPPFLGDTPELAAESAGAAPHPSPLAPRPSAYYLSCNRGKRSLALDLAHPGAREVLDDLVRAADVLAENFLPHSLEKLGLEPARLAAINPRLVHVAISGYGRTGPDAGQPGYDLVIQAMSGLMSITGEPDGAPMKIGVAITDVLSGLYAAVSALSGLLVRERGGKSAGGSSFDIALADAAIAALVNVAQSTLLTGERPIRYGNAHPQIVPYEAFAAADAYFVLAVGNDAQWRKLCAILADARLTDDPRLATNPGRVEQRTTLIPMLAEHFRQHTWNEWRSLFEAAQIPHGPVLPLDEAVKLPQFAIRQMLPRYVDAQGREFALVGNPIHIDGATMHADLPPPELGQHTGAALRDWLAYSDERIASLRASGVIGR